MRRLHRTRTTFRRLVALIAPARRHLVAEVKEVSLPSADDLRRRTPAVIRVVEESLQLVSQRDWKAERPSGNQLWAGLEKALAEYVSLTAPDVGFVPFGASIFTDEAYRTIVRAALRLAYLESLHQGLDVMVLVYGGFGELHSAIDAYIYAAIAA